MHSRSKYLVITVDFILPLLTAALLFGTWLFVFHSEFFTLTQIECELDYQPCQHPGVVSELNKYLDRNLVALKLEPLRSRLLSGEFTLREVRFHKLLPHTLEVELLSSYPVAALRLADSGSKWVTVDERYRVTAVRDVNPNVPTVTVLSLPAFQLGARLPDEQLVQTLAIARQISNELVSTRSLSLSATTLTITLSSGHTAYLTTTKDLLPQLRLLESLLADKQVASQYSIIDVRYYQPILK